MEKQNGYKLKTPSEPRRATVCGDDTKLHKYVCPGKLYVLILCDRYQYACKHSAPYVMAELLNFLKSVCIMVNCNHLLSSADSRLLYSQLFTEVTLSCKYRYNAVSHCEEDGIPVWFTTKLLIILSTMVSVIYILHWI